MRKYLFIIIDTVLTLIFLSGISTKNHEGFISWVPNEHDHFHHFQQHSPDNTYPCTIHSTYCVYLDDKIVHFIHEHKYYSD